METRDRALDLYQMYYGSPDEIIVDYYMDGPMDLLIKFEDGRVRLFNMGTHTTRLITFGELTDKQFRREFGYRLSRKMGWKRMTQKDLSEITGIQQSLISNYITGKTNPSLHNVYKISQALGCSIDELVYVDKFK